MTREELIMKVALKMDEISSSDDITVEVMASDNNPLYTQINGLLNESVNDVLMKAPTHRLYAHMETSSVAEEVLLFSNTRKAYAMSVPDNFLKFVSITDSSFFDRPITELFTEGDDIYKKQQNKHLVAKKAKPVAIMCNSPYGRLIYCYSYDAADSPTAQLLYIKRYNKADMYEDCGLDEYLIDIISWACAGKVFAAQGDITKGKTCDENALALMI